MAISRSIIIIIVQGVRLLGRLARSKRRKGEEVEWKRLWLACDNSKEAVMMSSKPKLNRLAR